MRDPSPEQRPRPCGSRRRLLAVVAVVLGVLIAAGAWIGDAVSGLYAGR